MSRTRIVKGKITEITGGTSRMYGNRIIINAGGRINYYAKRYTYGEPEEPPVKEFEESTAVVYETDGHYSTVYLVCLMLGMNEDDAEELAIATEAPDTTIHSELDFELNDTWSNVNYQGPVHSLTGGFHGIEEFITAVKFLWLKIDDRNREKSIRELGELLHRFGDTYAHSKLDNIKPDNLVAFDLYHSDKNLNLVIDSWRGQGGKTLAEDVEPWIQYINFYTKKYGYNFLTNQDYQRQAFKGQTLLEKLRDVYLLQPTDKFKMYGGGFFTTDHLTADDSYPDRIYIRPDWYLNYVKNLAWLLSLKFNLDLGKFNISIFEKMTRFATENKCSLKGIIDYEIAKKRGKREFYIPVFYSNSIRIAASADESFSTNYLKNAKEARSFAIKYMIEEANNSGSPEVEEITSLLNIKVSRFGNLFHYTKAYKLNF